mgnify:CR=1 FL=1
MLVQYKGNYRDQASVCFKGVSFEKGKPSEVTEEWFDACNSPNVVKAAAKPKPKKAAAKPE